MILIEKPSEFDLFGINPRWLIVERDNPDGHLVRMILHRWDGQEFVEVVTLSNFYGDQERITFNMSKLLDLEYDLPSTGSVTGFEYDFAINSMVKYAAILKEFDSEGNEIQQIAEEQFALNGGRSALENRRYDFYEDHSQSHKFLTLQPREKPVQKNQPEWLYYPIMEGDGLSHRVRAVLNFSDGTGDIITIAPSGTLEYTFEADKGKLVWLATGFNQLGLEQYETPDKLILSYQILVTSYQNFSLVQQSEQMSYKVNFEDASWEYRYFLFENNIGGMDTLCTRGKAEIKGKYDRSSRTVTETPNKAYARHPQRANRPTGKQEVKVNVGWIERPEREWLEDLMLSQNVWEIQIGQRDSEFIPILITSDNLDIHQDDESLQSSSFTYEYAKKMAR